MAQFHYLPFCSSQPNVIRLIDELGLQTFEQDVTGKKLLKLDNGDPTYYDDTTTYGLSLIGALDIYWGLKKVIYVLFSLLSGLIKI